MNIADLRKALDKLRDVLLDNDACDHILSEYDGFHDLFSIFQKDYGKLLKELAEANLLCELQASRISGLETFKKQCNGKVIVSRKQLSEPKHRDIDLFWTKYKQVKEDSKADLEVGFNGFIVGYELRNKELLEETKK